MKSRQTYKVLVYALMAVMMASCQKVIQIDLNSADPQIVIEANITDQPGPYYVKISRTVNYDQGNVFPRVSGARVIISDDTGIKDTLTEVETGLFRTSKILGIPGHSYQLSAEADGKVYEASASMAFPVHIDTLNVRSGGGGPGSGGKSGKIIRTLFMDPPGIENYYRFVLSVNGNILNTIRVTSDQFLDGQHFNIGIRSGDYEIRSGDVCTIYLQSINKPIYTYFQALDEQNGGFQQSASPANPPTNLSNNALGYFNVCSVSEKSVVVP